MHSHRMFLTPNRDVEDSLAFDRHGRSLIGCPKHGVAKEFRMVDIERLPKGAIDVSWKVDHAALPCVAEEDSGIVRRDRRRERPPPSEGQDRSGPFPAARKGLDQGRDVHLIEWR